MNTTCDCCNEIGDAQKYVVYMKGLRLTLCLDCLAKMFPEAVSYD